MKHEEKAQGNWEEIKNSIISRWHVSENDLIQSSGIPEMANFISNKVGEPRPNILHELIHLIRSIDQKHPLLNEYYDKTMAQGDDGSKLVRTETPQDKNLH